MTQKPLTKADLAQFIGTTVWYRHGLVRKVLYTEGVQYLAEHGVVYWLIDEIAFAQTISAFAGEGFQHWKLKVSSSDATAVLTCDDGNGNVVLTKAIPYTDFPLDGIDLYFTGNVIMLPSEY